MSDMAEAEAMLKARIEALESLLATREVQLEETQHWGALRNAQHYRLVGAVRGGTLADIAQAEREVAAMGRSFGEANPHWHIAAQAATDCFGSPLDWRDIARRRTEAS